MASDPLTMPGMDRFAGEERSLVSSSARPPPYRSSLPASTENQPNGAAPLLKSSPSPRRARATLVAATSVVKGFCESKRRAPRSTHAPAFWRRGQSFGGGCKERASALRDAAAFFSRPACAGNLVVGTDDNRPGGDAQTTSPQSQRLPTRIPQLRGIPVRRSESEG